MSRLALWFVQPASLMTAALLVAGCAGDGPGPMQQSAAPAPPAIPASAIAGRWGFTSYHREQDRQRTEQQARIACNSPYEIGLGPNGGVLIHPTDGGQRVELMVKGAPGNRTFVGPAGDPGGQEDREIIAYDGQIMIMRWMDPEVASRYGTVVFARCPEAGATAGRPPASRPAPARTNR